MSLAACKHSAHSAVLTFGGLRLTIYIFILLRPAPKTQSTHERALELVSGADFRRNQHFVEPEPVPGLPGPAVAPKGPKIGQNPGAGFIILPPEGLPRLG